MFESILGIVALVCMIWVIVDVWTKNSKDDTGMKIVWTVCAVLFSIITAIVYYFVRKK